MYGDFSSLWAPLQEQSQALAADGSAVASAAWMLKSQKVPNRLDSTEQLSPSTAVPPKTWATSNIASNAVERFFLLEKR